MTILQVGIRWIRHIIFLDIFFFQAEDGIRDGRVTGVQTCALPIYPPDHAFSADRIRAHVAFLADDLLEGREAGTRGHEIAAKYVATEFELLGVKPGGQNGGYFEPVNLLEASDAGPKPSVRLATPHGSRTLAQGVAAVIHGPIGGGSGSVSAPLVFVG